MAEASLLSQKAALLEQDNFKTMLTLQKEESQSQAQESTLERDQHLKELQLNHEERKSTTMLLQKMVERLCPEEDPTERFGTRKQKLDELRAVLGEELYATKLNQLKEEFVKRAAL